MRGDCGSDDEGRDVDEYEILWLKLRLRVGESGSVNVDNSVELGMIRERFR